MGRSAGGGTADGRRLREDEARRARFARWRDGVEAFVEPRTTVTETTVVLVAHDGEWTRRRIDDEQSAFRLGRKLGLPVYEVSKVGYPKRMREYTARQRAQSRRQATD